MGGSAKEEMELEKEKGEGDFVCIAARVAVVCGAPRWTVCVAVEACVAGCARGEGIVACRSIDFPETRLNWSENQRGLLDHPEM